MIVSITKSLIMLLVIQYHFNFRGGWKRLVVCSAANLMSGLLSPLLEYGAGLLLPVDSSTEMKPAPDWELLFLATLIGALLHHNITRYWWRRCPTLIATYILFLCALSSSSFHFISAFIHTYMYINNDRMNSTV
uniref:Uncharacterized protein n=1 Tax=Trypanosoma congolense (strain IL3000) TaxID=1068625 RepID=F9WK02_TRYCI|nr:hypothetical protein, unlikely [Trypanosoma congolense IL3000]